VNKVRDGNYAFAKVEEYLAKNDPPVICISATNGGIFGSEGHCIVPYATSQSGTTKKIWVYDPNRTWYGTGANGRDWFTNHLNFITVNASTGAWSFTMADGTTWSGDPGNGGRIITAPLSVTGRKDRLPQSLFAEAAYTLNTIFIFGNVTVEQIKDPTSGRQLVNDAGTDMEQCEEKRMNNLFGFMPFSGGRSLPTGKDRTAFFKGSNPVQIGFKAAGKYRIGMLFNGKYYEMSGTGNGEPLVFSPEKKYELPGPDQVN
jgi:hypothetical protein